MKHYLESALELAAGTLDGHRAGLDLNGHPLGDADVLRGQDSLHGDLSNDKWGVGRDIREMMRHAYASDTGMHSSRATNVSATFNGNPLYCARLCKYGYARAALDSYIITRIPSPLPSRLTNSSEAMGSKIRPVASYMQAAGPICNARHGWTRMREAG